MAQAVVQGLRNALGVVASPFVKLGMAYGAAAEKRPFTVGVLTTGIKTSAADLFAQMVLEKKGFDEIDGKRHFTFCLFGFTYLGAFQYFFYTKVLVWATNPITRTMGHIGSAPAKTFVDQAFHHPFMYFPTFYLMKYSLVGGESVEVAMTRYSDELWPNCNALWKLWVPCQLLNFSVVPIHLQVPYVAAVSFVWTIILSMMRGADTGAVEDKQAVDAPAEVAELRLIEAPSDTGIERADSAAADGGKSESARTVAPQAALASAAAEKTAEGSVAAGTGVPIEGTLAVASQSAENPEQVPAVAAEVTRLPQHAPTIKTLAVAAAVPEIGFSAHAAHAPQRDLQSSAVAAAASISEQSPAHKAGAAHSSKTSASAAASIAEPLLCCPHEGSVDVAVSGAVVLWQGVARCASLSIDRLAGCSGAAGGDVVGLWGGAAGLLHLQHPLEAGS